MSSCTMCGSSVPSGQTVCSMCYGDIDYGRDGYYREWAEAQVRDAERQAEDEARQRLDDREFIEEQERHLFEADERRNAGRQG